MSIKVKSTVLESIIEIGSEEWNANPNGTKSQWTFDEEISRKEAKIFSDPIVILKRFQVKSTKKASYAIELAKTHNPGLGCFDPHFCHICFKISADRCSLARHLSTTHAKAPALFCDHCPKRYFDKTLLRQHMKSHMKKHLACNVCGFKTADIGIMRKHKLTHVRNEKCKICDKRVTSLRMHMIGHAPKETCDICGKNITKYGMKTHLKTHEKHKCEQCNQNFKSSEDVRRHNLRAHHKGEIFECHCGSVFKNKLLLYTHKLKHKSEKASCNVCGKSYVYETGFRRHWQEQHSKTHGPVRNKTREIHRESAALNHKSPHICDLCGSKYANRLVFRNHINRRHLHPKTYFCDLCPKAFKEKQALPVHFRQKHLNWRPFSCDTCGLTFYAKAWLRNHLSKKQCRVECKICHRRVANMASHMTYHFKVKCPTCGKAMRKNSLWQHMKLHSSKNRRIK